MTPKTLKRCFPNWSIGPYGVFCPRWMGQAKGVEENTICIPYRTKSNGIFYRSVKKISQTGIMTFGFGPFDRYLDLLMIRYGKWATPLSKPSALWGKNDFLIVSLFYLIPQLPNVFSNFLSFRKIEFPQVFYYWRKRKIEEIYIIKALQSNQQINSLQRVFFLEIKTNSLPKGNKETL